MEDWRPVTEIATLRNKILGFPSTAHNSSADLSPLQLLAQDAEEKLWDDLPLCAIAEAHKRKAENLMARGNPDENGPGNISEVYVEYLKYLNLYPYKNDKEYIKTFATVHMLEQVINGTASANSLRGHLGSRNSLTWAGWIFLIMGPISAAFWLRQVLSFHR
ncbi:hypothetical protein DFH07DRAFT_793571 [Mycena maculata]|uniref:Uncharacterized protein n=1 Tax=Mycena maculata TaxID=230809 RepID=A0AAD7K7P2_9AGAR|nr:hypothetical protein DFH07DRAFT_793571 [Mycena maculata]